MKFLINKAKFETEKEIDGNNFLVAYDVPIAKTGIQQYSREEIGDDSGNPDELVKVYRDETVFKDNELVNSFDGIPIVYRHPDSGKVDNTNFKDYIVGTVSGVYFKNGSLYAQKLTIIDKEAIEKVLKKETNELSIGFRGTVEKKKGKFQGEEYEFKENVIHANHLALCENGKAGSYYAINSKRTKGKNMNNGAEGADASHSELNPAIHALIEKAVEAKMKAIKPKNFGDGQSEKEEHWDKTNEKSDENHVEKEAKHDEKGMACGDSSDPSLEESEHMDKDIINQIKRTNQTLKDMVDVKNQEIRKLSLTNAQLEEALIFAKDKMKEMSVALKTRKISHALAGPDSILSPSHPRMVDMSNSITSSFVMK